MLGDVAVIYFWCFFKFYQSLDRRQWEGNNIITTYHHLYFLLRIVQIISHFSFFPRILQLPFFSLSLYQVCFVLMFQNINSIHDFSSSSDSGCSRIGFMHRSFLVYKIYCFIRLSNYKSSINTSRNRIKGTSIYLWTFLLSYSSSSSLV